MAPDEDELDALIITDKPIENNKHYNVTIVGALIMEDEKGRDDKILCVLEEDSKLIRDIDDFSHEIKEAIFWFFSNYKSLSPGKWSRVFGFDNKKNAIENYLNSKLL